MLILAFDTSTGKCSVALSEDGNIIRKSTSDAMGDHAQRLFLSIKDLFEETGRRLSEVNLIVAGTGPGSFTGIRVGLSAAHGLASSLKVPLAGVSGLDAIAARIFRRDVLACPILDARRGEVYAALYKGAVSAERITELKVWTLDELCGRLAESGRQIITAGSGCRRHRDLLEERLGARIGFRPEEDDTPGAESAALLVWERIKSGERLQGTAAPVYLRKSEAEIRSEVVRNERHHRENENGASGRSSGD